MKHQIAFTGDGWDDFSFWMENDKSKVRKINALIRDIDREGTLNGTGHPEPLKYREGFSRRIDHANRLVYQITDETIIIKSCKGHYEEK